LKHVRAMVKLQSWKVYEAAMYELTDRKIYFRTTETNTGDSRCLVRAQRLVVVVGEACSSVQG
jgi:hypothetical protein